MPNFNGIEIHDLLGMSEPITKLIETVSGGIGKVYEPLHIKRVAKAKKEELEIISNAINSNLQLPMKYENGSITIDTTDVNELLYRTQKRLLFQEMKKQQNIESVVGVAYAELEQVPSVNKTPVDSDWISEFFNDVANISNEEMQILWGKLLAGEVRYPGSFSLRTLSVLKNLTQRDASVFQEVVPFILSCPADSENTYYDYFLMDSLGSSENGILRKNSIPFTKILLLCDAGILVETPEIQINVDIKANTEGYIKGINKAIKIVNKSKKEATLQIRHAAWLLTEAGKELFHILATMNHCKVPDIYITECLHEIKNYGLVFPTEPIEADELEFVIVSI